MQYAKAYTMYYAQN